MRVANSSHKVVKAGLYIDLLNRLAEEDIPYSFAISKILWELSLYLPTGSYVENWRKYNRASDAAEVIRSSVKTVAEMKKQLRFEHPLPLNNVYSRIAAGQGKLMRAEVAEIICEFPPVLVTRAEDDEIIKRKLRDSGDPFERYKNIRLSFDLKGTCVVSL